MSQKACMARLRTVLRVARHGQVAALVLGVVITLGTAVAWTTGWRHSNGAEEMRWLRVRLAEKRDLIARQRLEMAEVAAAVDHLARTAGAVGDRAEQARRLAHMEESRDATPDLLHLISLAETGGAIVSEDAARTLEQLAWLEGETMGVGDSLAVLTALLKDRPMSASKGMPSLWPVHGLVTSSFGMRPSPYGGGRELHPGIDIQARYGMPVTAGGDGKVIFAGRDPGYGGLVVIDHGADVDTFYGHLSTLYVREGQNIRRGQPLGAVGASGRATGVHLHYEVRVHGTPVDPHRYLN